MEGLKNTLALLGLLLLFSYWVVDNILVLIAGAAMLAGAAYIYMNQKGS